MQDIQSVSSEQIRSDAKKLKKEGRAFIGGEYVASLSGKTFQCVSPVDGQAVVDIASCDKEDVDRAVQSCRQAFEDRRWCSKSPSQRKSIMLELANLIRKNRQELAVLETLDMGKPIKESFNTDIPLAADCIQWFAEAIDKIYDEIAPTPETSLAMITREPLGVVAAVIPWNFPLLMAAWKLGPALAAGNSVLIKPAEQSSLTAIRLGALCIEAGIPEGVVNIVPGLGENAGKAIGLHPDVDAVTFTGSSQVGKFFLEYSGQSNMKRIYLECGGKSPHIVLGDCHDLDEAAQGVASGIFYNQGEVCNAGSRLLVEKSIKGEFLERVVELGKKIQPSDPWDMKTEMGAIVDSSQLDRILGYIETGSREGAKIVLGGERVNQETGGLFVQPTIFDGVSNEMTIAQDEIFGPVLSTIEVESLEQAIEIGNRTQFGLAAAIWTRDVKKAHLAARRLRAGTVWVNCFDHGSITVPFGGFKQSGIGRDKSLHAIDKFCEMKTTWLNLS